jgi:hypothetical protein
MSWKNELKKIDSPSVGPSEENPYNEYGDGEFERNKELADIRGVLDDFVKDFNHEIRRIRELVGMVSGGQATDYFDTIDEDFIQPIDKIRNAMSKASRNVERNL